ncbi:MAG: sulfite exporter TauE/SafE family protein [Bdellovibrionota bacterium]
MTGISLGLIGGGGSILIVPVLVYLFNVSPELATAYSLFVVGIASLVGSYKYAKMNLIEYKTALIFAAPAFIGVFSARRFIIPSLPPTILTSEWLTLNKETLIMLVFAIVMLLASFSMIRKKPSNQEDQKSNNQKFIYNYKMIALEGLGVGTLTGFVGAGGGFLIIPALVLFAKLPMKLAIGTSLIIISAKSLLGFLGDLATSQAIDWSFLIKISFTAIVGIIAGTYLNQFIPGRKLQPAFGWFILVMGTYILARQII